MAGSWISFDIATRNQQLGGIPVDDPPVEVVPAGAAVPFIDTGDGDKKNGVGGLIRFTAFVSAVVSQIGASLVIGTLLQGSAVAAATADRTKSLEVANGIMVNVAPLNPGATTDIDAKILQTLDLADASGCREIVLPPGEWRVPANFLVTRGGLASGTTIRGAWPGATTIYLQSNGTRRGFWHTGNDRTGITFKDLKFVGGFCDDASIIVGSGCRDVHIQDIECVNAQLATVGGAASWEASNSSNWTYGTVIERCRGTGNNSFTSQGQFIFVNYSWNWIVRDCRATGYNHGVQWWGGDGAYESTPGKTGIGKGDLFNERKCGRGLVDNCEFITINGAAVWGSMGSGITVLNCYGKDCGDINFDSESGDDILFDNCRAENGRNALFGTYFAQRKCTFRNCRGYFTDNTIASGGALRFYGCWNDSATPPNHKDVVLEGCHFEASVLAANGAFAKVCQELGPTYNIKVVDCYFRNGVIDLFRGNNRQMAVHKCEFEFSLVPGIAQNVIFVGRSQWTDGGVADADYDTVVTDCLIMVDTAAWPTGSSAILLYYTDTGLAFVWSSKIGGNRVKWNGSKLTYGYRIVNDTTDPNALIRCHFGDNTAPDAYEGGGTVKQRALFIDDTTSQRPTQVIPYAPNKSQENGVEFGPILTRTLTMVKVPGAISGQNTIALTDTSNLQVGDTIRMTGCTNAGNNATDFRITAIVANTSITVNRVVEGTATEPDSGLTMQTTTITATPLTNETPPGTARLYKRILAGTKRLVTTSAVGAAASLYAEAGTGFQALARMRYEASCFETGGTTLTADEQLDWIARCYVHGTMTFYVENPTSTDIDCADVTLYTLATGRVQ